MPAPSIIPLKTSIYSQRIFTSTPNHTAGTPIQRIYIRLWHAARHQSKVTFLASTQPHQTQTVRGWKMCSAAAAAAAHQPNPVATAAAHPTHIILMCLCCTYIKYLCVYCVIQNILLALYISLCGGGLFLCAYTPQLYGTYITIKAETHIFSPKPCSALRQKTARCLWWWWWLFFGVVMGSEANKEISIVGSYQKWDTFSDSLFNMISEKCCTDDDSFYETMKSKRDKKVSHGSEFDCL